jgi:hypothetical protein
MRRLIALALVLIPLPLAACVVVPSDEPVRIDYYVHGELWVERGGTLEIDARVVSDATGQRLPGYPVDGTATGGALSEHNDRGLIYFRFQADRDIPPPYVITLTADSAGGGDTVTIRIEAGWQFADASYVSHLDDNLPEIGERWSGRVCGNPFGPWQFERVITETDVQNTESFQAQPRPLDDRGGQEFGGVPMIAANPGERSGEAPFLLWIDDVSPPDFVPQVQRIEVAVEPLSAEECA